MPAVDYHRSTSSASLSEDFTLYIVYVTNQVKLPFLYPQDDGTYFLVQKFLFIYFWLLCAFTIVLQLVVVL